MSKYNVGDKFVIEIAEIFRNNEDDIIHEAELYRIQGFNTLVFDDYGLDKLQKINPKLKIEDIDDMLAEHDLKKESYEKGLTDAWELARKIALYEENGGYSSEYIINAFGIQSHQKVLMTFNPQEALAKIEAYEKKKAEIKVGDVVTTINGECEYLVTNIQLPNTLHVVNSRNGYTQQMRIDVTKKTGKHIDIESLLEQIRED